VNNLYQVLGNAFEKHPEQTALVFGARQISFKDLKMAADRLAGGLQNKGFQKGDRVALMLPNVPHFSICYFALLKLGAVIVPISIFYKAEEIHHQLEDSEVKGIIYWEGFRQPVRQAVHDLEGCEHLIVLGDKVEAGEVRLNYLMETHEPLEEVVEVESDTTALVIYTAGTPGRTRGAELTHVNILSNIQACVNFLSISSDDGVVGVLPLYHMLGQTVVMNCFLSAGARIVLVPKFDAKNILEIIAKEKPTYFVGVPSMYREILKLEDVEEDTSSLKFCLSSGDALRQETMEAFEERFKVPILEGYGLTEASPMISFNNTTHERKAGSIGLPLPGVDMRIVDESDAEIRSGQIGEIVVQGPNIMKGYLNRPEATKEAIRDGWFRTGDFARLNDSGFGFIVVRKKNVIVKSGFNVYPREVEKFLHGHPKVKEAVVVGVPDNIKGEEIHASIILKESEQATPEEIIEYIKERMAAYKCPKFIHFVDSFPIGPTGRVMRDKVKGMLIPSKVGEG